MIDLVYLAHCLSPEMLDNLSFYLALSLSLEIVDDPPPPSISWFACLWRCSTILFLSSALLAFRNWWQSLLLSTTSLISGDWIHYFNIYYLDHCLALEMKHNLSVQSSRDHCPFVSLRSISISLSHCEESTSRECLSRPSLPYKRLLILTKQYVNVLCSFTRIYITGYE